MENAILRIVQRLEIESVDITLIDSKTIHHMAFVICSNGISVNRSLSIFVRVILFDKPDTRNIGYT